MNLPVSSSLYFLPRTGLALLLAAALTSGCGQDGIKSYDVPKERLPSPDARTTMPPDHPDVSAAPEIPQLKWVTPENWKELPAGRMRVASFKVAGLDGKQADVSVIPLPGDVGGDFANVNRWRGQVGQPPLSMDQLKAFAQPVELAGQPATLYEQNGENPAGEPTRILAVIQHRDSVAWFFKMTGDNQLVTQEKSAFVQFLKSVHFETGTPSAMRQSAQPPMADESLPAGHPDISSTMPVGTPPVASSSDGKPKWAKPPGWKEAPGGQFLVAKFTITGEGGGQAAVNVSSSAGDGGGLAANVNRWRKQLGLNALGSDELAKSAKAIPTASGSATLVEMSGQDARSGQPAALVGVIVLQPEHAWFYKLMGDATVVADQKELFTRFVQGVIY